MDEKMEVSDAVRAAIEVLREQEIMVKMLPVNETKREWFAAQAKKIGAALAGLHALSAGPAAPDDRKVAAHRVLRRRQDGEWVNDARCWHDGAPSEELAADTASREGWKIELAYAHAPVATAGMDPSVEQQRDMLAQAIRDAAVKAGIARADAPMTGPMLLMLCEDLASAAAAPAPVADVLTEEQKAMQDAMLSGTGFMFGGKRLNPDHLRIVSVPVAGGAVVRELADRVEGLLTAWDDTEAREQRDRIAEELRALAQDRASQGAAVTREEAERFLAQYHAELWAAAEADDPAIAYDDAGRNLAKQFLARFNTQGDAA